MKKIVILAMAFVLLASAAAWAGDNRAFSYAQEQKIRKAIGDVYPSGVKIVTEDIGGGDTRIICRAKYMDDYFLFTASANGNLKLNEIYPGSAFRTGIKLEEKIFRVLNPSASE
mgnify:CR=1 FL=1